METASLKDLLREHIELKGLTPKKIADLAGIPERYVDMLLEGDTAKLPPAPYVHGYIAKLSGILNFDKETMWRLYQKESLLRRSGDRDRLPNNRFAARRVTRTFAIGGTVVALALAWFGYAAYDAFTPPMLTVTVPGSENSTVAQPTILLQGTTDPAYTVTVNGSELYVGADGAFQKELRLREGLNTVEFSAKKFMGHETRVIRRIVYAPSAQEEEPEAEMRPIPKKNGQSTSTAE